MTNKPPISIFTITNNPKWLSEAWESLKAQTFADFEWIILPNGGVKRDDIPESAGWLKDDRVFVAPETLSDDIEPGNIGALKAQACAVAHGDVLVEFDHDDLLLPDALAKVYAAFDSDSSIGMVYSNCCRVNDDWTPNLFGDGYGWQYREVEAFGHQVLEMVSPAPLPQNLSRIFYAPDHCRSWRASDYHRIGGHDASLKVGDDHDLICRFYLESKIHHIDEPLYIYRIHGANNWLERNAEVQTQQWRNYEKYIQPMAQKWSDEQGLKTVDLTGCGEPRWMLETSSVGLLLAPLGLQHLPDPIATMNEAYRVLAHGGVFLIEIPATDGRGAWMDVTAKSFWNQNSFWYWTQAQYQHFYKKAGANARFQVLELKTYYPTEWHQGYSIPMVRAHLIAHKDDSRRFHGALEI